MRQTTVAVAVSGGADSLFSLITLREQGFPVIALHGIFLKPGELAARQRQEAMRARLAEQCDRLNIPLFLADFSQAFEKEVISPFVQSYARGETPNPCALCNARIKFGLLQDHALALGAGFMATGHYARLAFAEPRELHAHLPALLQGNDAGKDQSYFLALTPARRLARALFPLGEASKKDVLASLARQGIIPPQPEESQEICFVPNDAYREYLPGMADSLGIPLPGPGPMLLKDGQRITGAHKGLWRYTEGQRRGLGVAWKEPLYVFGKDMERNALILAAKTEMAEQSCLCRDVNILLSPEHWPETLLVKTRYRERHKAARAEIIPGPGGRPEALRLTFLEEENVAAPGQIAAIYMPYPAGALQEHNPLRLVAGGIIAREKP